MMGVRVHRQAPVIAVTAEQRAAVEGPLRQPALRPRRRERLEMGKAAALGQDLATIVAWSGRSVETVRHWLGRFVTGGVAALGDGPRSGRPPEAGAAYLARLEALVETPPRACGLPYDVWTSARLSAALAEQTGVRIAPSWRRTLPARRRCASGRPKHTLAHLQDPAEVAACAAALAAVGGGRWRPRRNATNSTTRMRRTWRPPPPCAASGTARACSRPSRRWGRIAG